jgi:hypothetical protein
MKITRRQLRRLIIESFRGISGMPPLPEMNRDIALMHLSDKQREMIKNHPNENIRMLANSGGENLNMAIMLADSMGYFDELKISLGLSPEDMADNVVIDDENSEDFDIVDDADYDINDPDFDSGYFD